MDKKKGILIVIVPSTKKIMIMTGPHWDNTFTDEDLKNILNKTMNPYIREAKYYEGSKAGIFAMMKFISGT